MPVFICLVTCRDSSDMSGKGKLGTAAGEGTHEASHLIYVCTGVPISRLPSGKTNMGSVNFQRASAFGDRRIYAVGRPAAQQLVSVPV